MMLQLTLVVFCSTLATSFPFPRNTLERIRKTSKADLESSGVGPGEPVRGLVRVLQLDPRGLAPSTTESLIKLQ